MKISRGVAAALAFAAASMVLAAGCGSSDGADSGSRSTLQYVPTTSYALKAPETTTTTLAPAASDAATEAGGTVPTEQSYTIKSNDSLSKIANLFDVDIELICSYNGWSDCLTHLLLPGDTILIPPNAAAPGAAATSTDSSATADSSTDSATDATASEGGSTEEGIGCSHTIVAGDNPSRVASKYDITVEQLAAANVNNPAYTNFLIGSSLNIPPEGSC